MAKFNSSTFGTISGRHGNAVASIGKDGQNILRLYKAPSNPNTKAQITQRSKFGFANSELSPFRDIFKITFRNNKGMNQAVSYALKNAIIGTSPNFSLDYSKLSFAWGSIQFPDDINVAVLTGTTIKIDWDTTLRTEDETPDELNLVLMNADSKFTILREKVAIRDEGTVTYELPQMWAGKKVNCWVFFSTPESNQTSISMFLGLLQL
jgi:hypothetical protein